MTRVAPADSQIVGMISSKECIKSEIRVAALQTVCVARCPQKHLQARNFQTHISGFNNKLNKLIQTGRWKPGRERAWKANPRLDNVWLAIKSTSRRTLGAHYSRILESKRAKVFLNLSKERRSFEDKPLKGINLKRDQLADFFTPFDIIGLTLNPCLNRCFDYRAKALNSKMFFNLMKWTWQ